ncbi:hypothetical protein JCM10207_003243 [Rhodosporidiobolus poonsookiae]
MRSPLALPLPLALLVLVASSGVPAASSPSPSLQPAHTALQQPQLFVRPRFLPPERYRERVRRQDTASGDTAQTGGTGQEQQQSDTAQQTTSEAAQTTTDAAQTTTEAATTTQEQQTSTLSQETTSQPQQTTTNQQTTSQGTTTSQQSPSDGTTSTPTSQSSSSSSSSGSSAPSSGTSSGTSTTSSASESKSASSTMSSVEVTFTSTFTNADGSVGTSTGTTMTPSAVPIKSGGGGSSTGKTWGIVGGVVGGVIVVGALVFVVYRMTQRRFSSIDDEPYEIKWPELQADGQNVSTNTSTLRPLDTHRTGGAGVGDDDASTYGGGDMGAGSIYGAGAGAGAHGRAGSQSTLLGMGAMTHSRQASYERLAMADSGGYPSMGGPGGHYDPFLGPAAYPPMQGPPSGGIVYPPPHYLAGAGAEGYHPAMSADSHHSAPSRAMVAPAGAEYEHLSAESLSRNPSSSVYSTASPLDAAAGAAGPRGAPGAGGARTSISGSFDGSRAGSPALGARSEAPFRVPSPEFGTGGLGLGGEREMSERRGPL